MDKRALRRGRDGEALREIATLASLLGRFMAALS
jgi:hypothetical protein